jgi:hypothetical protein
MALGSLITKTGLVLTSKVLEEQIKDSPHLWIPHWPGSNSVFGSISSVDDGLFR